MADLKGVQAQAAETAAATEKLATGGVILPLSGKAAEQNAREIAALEKEIAEIDRAILAGETEIGAATEARTAKQAQFLIQKEREVVIQLQLEAAEATLAGNPRWPPNSNAKRTSVSARSVSSAP